MKKQLFIIIFLLISGSVSFPLSSEPKIVQTSLSGIAKDNNSKIFYKEKSILTFKNNKLQEIDSSFVKADGTPIATMHSDLLKNPYLPDISMKDLRDQYEYKIIYSPDEKKVEIYQKENDGSEWVKKKISYQENLTNSVGLMNYIRDHADELMKMKQKVFRYIIPSRQDDYGMIVEFLKEENSILYFKFKIENPFIRSIAGSGETLVSFDKKSSQITEFTGAALLLDENDKRVDVTVTYVHQR